MFRRWLVLAIIISIASTGCKRLPKNQQIYSKQTTMESYIKVTDSLMETNEPTKNNSKICIQEESNILSFRVIKSNKLVSVCIGEGAKSYIVLRIKGADNIHEYPIDRENSWKYFKYSYYSRGGGDLNDALDLNYLTYEDEMLKIKINEEYSYDEDGEKNVLTLTTTNKVTGEETEQVGDIDSKEGSLIDIRDNENIITIPYQDE